MATISFAKSAAVMNISGSFPQTPSTCIPSSSVSFLKVSRVSFSSIQVSSFNSNQDKNVAAKEMKCRAKDPLAEQAVEKINEGIAKAIELSDSAIANVTENIGTAKAKAGELLDQLKDNTSESIENVKGKGEELKEKTEDVAGSVKDNVVEGTEKATETASNLGEEAKESVLDVGEKAKEVAKEAWEATMDTTQKVKEAVIETDDAQIHKALLRKNINLAWSSALKGLRMAAATPLRRVLSCVILDLDGTLLNTDGIVGVVLKMLLVKYGKQWDAKVAHRIVGKTPIEAATAIKEDYELPCTTDEFMSELTPMFSERWCSIRALPGANRLIKHLKGHGVPLALVSNSSRESIETKLSYHEGWKESFSAIIGGDEVRMRKPSPETFLEAAKLLNAEPPSCLVIEDSLPDVGGAKAAGMEVVAVPSLPKSSHLYTSADEVINSLLDLRPEIWGLPPFQDWINGTLPIELWYIGSPVIKGYGRGSKVLGIPTANLSTEGWSDILSYHPLLNPGCFMISMRISMGKNYVLPLLAIYDQRPIFLP
ncbi:hypothetical protein MKW98_015355 [Papaver atlanticum]|uniref:Riboflavin kinase n=1 Tax=Papaver atlanticum TaxID=357466 RepID=A0AAD4XNX8_9MAGN|nr:hypothetical protein MKW98_015355 [Papaver atlanticum]